MRQGGSRRDKRYRLKDTSCQICTMTKSNILLIHDMRAILNSSGSHLRFLLNVYTTATLITQNTGVIM